MTALMTIQPSAAETKSTKEGPYSCQTMAGPLAALVDRSLRHAPQFNARSRIDPPSRAHSSELRMRPGTRHSAEVDSRRVVAWLPGGQRIDPAFYELDGYCVVGGEPE